MPQVQVVDLTERKPEPTGVEKFFSRINQVYKDESDRVKIGNLINEYQQNREDANAWENLQLGLEKSDISPTRRLEAQQNLNEIQKMIIAKDKAIREQKKAVDDDVKAKAKEDERARVRESLRQAGATQQQIDLYDAASVGGQTKLMDDIIEDVKRNKTPPGLLGEGVEDRDKGLTPKERVERQEKRFSLQMPLIHKNSESLNSLESEGMSINLLQELDEKGKIGEGVHNLNINPKSGELIIPKAGTADEQLFVKTVNDFTTKAKDSYGARVSNFELDRFMMRLPTLANSKEGRQLILRQMNIINQINTLEKKALQEVFDQYGVRNIDYPDAENLARAKIADQKEALRKEFISYENLSKKAEAEHIKKVKEAVREGHTVLRNIKTGVIKQYPNKNIPNLLETKRYERI